MVLKITHKELKSIIEYYWKTKTSLLVQGRFGIGKSVSAKDKAKDKAKELGREYREWNGLTESEKLAMFDNPKKYYVYIDIRLSEYSPDDIKGLPIFMSNNRAIEFKVPLWALYLELPDSDGFLMFDEINLSSPLVMSSCYKIVYDRVVNQSRINPNWFIIMAGNTSEDRAYTHDIAPPLRDRCGEVELNVPNKEDWVEWAIKNGINATIIGYISFKYGDLWVVDYDDNQKFTTPRGWERVSKLIQDIDVKNYDLLNMITSSAIGEGVASRYVAFNKLREKINLKEILKNPEKIRDLDNEKDLGLLYFLITAIADNYRTKEVEFKGVMKITEVLDDLGKVEFVALLWRLCLSYNPDFEKEFLKGDTIKVANKYLKYL